MELQQILWAALERIPSERPAFLDEACRGDARLRETAEALLRSHEEAGSFLERPAVVPPSPLDERFKAGERIGPYRLIAPIGEGGMGTVWRAEQERPVRREVALKLMRSWMASREFVARFEAERQALALMDHPNIAKVFDAGSVGDAPYLVMELVDGAPLSRFCDEHMLPLRRRLELLMQVCRGVQHAHERGVIHRDLKPTNILVGLYGGEPVPKVIDFGVAKAIGGRLAGRTVHTEAGQLVGTLEYMAPEQARLDPSGLDTRADVYALGVILYELLTGTTPHERLRGCGLAEGLRIVEEEEPPSPGARLAAMAPTTVAEVALRRGTTAERLRRTVRGDLGWIAAKCLEKDRLRRYGSAAALAEDLERHVAHHPVSARPPAAAYRARKFVRRHPTASVAVVAAVALVAGSVAFAFRVQADRAERDVRRVRVERDVIAALNEARTERERALGALRDANAWKAALAAALSAVRRAEALAAQGGADLGAALAREVVATGRALAADEGDRRLLARLEEIRDETARVDVRAGHYVSRPQSADVFEAFREWGVECGATPVAGVAARITSRPPTIQPRLIDAYWTGYYLLVPWIGPDGAAMPWFRDLIRLIDSDPWRRAIERACYAQQWDSVERLIDELDASTQPWEFLETYAKILQGERVGIAVRLLKKTQHAYPAEFWANVSLARSLMDSNRREEALPYLHAAVALRPDNAGAWVNLGAAHNALRPGSEEAIRAYQRAVDLEPLYTGARVNVGCALWHAGRREEAVAALRAAVHRDPEHAEAHRVLGVVLSESGRAAEGLLSLRRAAELDPRSGAIRRDLGMALNRTGDTEGALAAYREAIALDPMEFDAFNQLGIALKALGEHEAAASALRSAIALKPGSGQAHSNLAMALRSLLDWETAREHAEKAVTLLPDNANAQYNLSLVLEDAFDLDGAIAACRRAVEIEPDNVAFRNWLAQYLLNAGRPAEAVEVISAAERLIPAEDPRRASLRSEATRRAARAADRLAEVLAGREEVDDRLSLIRAATAKRFFRGAARLAEAYDVEAEFAKAADGPYYVARCFAFAAAGDGDASGASESERTAWRAQALRSLRVMLAKYRPLLMEETDPARGICRGILYRVCRWDPAFVSLRPPRLPELPEGERHEWRRLWSEVEEALR